MWFDWDQQGQSSRCKNMGAIMRSDNMNLREFENEVCVIWKKNLFKKWFFFFFFFVLR
jgi:hypothetical protein